MSEYSKIKKLLYASALIVSFSDYTVASGGGNPFQGLKYEHDNGEYIVVVDKNIVDHFSEAYNSYIKENKNDERRKSKEFKKSLQSLAVICNSVIRGKTEEELVYTLDELGLTKDGKVVDESGILTSEQLSAIMGELFKDILTKLADKSEGKLAGEFEDYIPRCIATFWGGGLLFEENLIDAGVGTVAVFKYLESLNKNKNKEYQRIVDNVVKYFGILKLNEFEPFANDVQVSDDNSEKEEKHEKKYKKQKIKEDDTEEQVFEVEPSNLTVKDIEEIETKVLEKTKNELYQLINDTFTRLDLKIKISDKWILDENDIPLPPPLPGVEKEKVVVTEEMIKNLDNVIVKKSKEMKKCYNLLDIMSIGLKNVGLSLSKNEDGLLLEEFDSMFITNLNPEPAKPEQIDQIYCLSSSKIAPGEISWKFDYSKDPLLGAKVFLYDTKEIKSYSKEDIKLEPKAVTINNPKKAEEIRNSIEQRDGKDKLDEALKSVLKNHVQSFDDYIKAKQKLFAENKEKLVGKNFTAETTYKAFTEICKTIDEMNNKISPLLSSLADAGAKSYKDMKFVIDGKNYNYTDLKKWLGGIVTSMNDEFKSELFKKTVFEKLFIDDKTGKKEYIMRLFESLLNTYKKIIDQKWQKENNEKSDNENKKLEDEIKKIQQKNDLQYLNELYSLYFGGAIDRLLQISDNKERIELIAKNMKTKLGSATKYQEELDKKEKRPKLNYEKKTDGKSGKSGGLDDKIKFLENKMNK